MRRPCHIIDFDRDRGDFVYVHIPLLALSLMQQEPDSSLLAFRRESLQPARLASRIEPKQGQRGADIPGVDGRAWSSAFVELVDLCRQDEIALCQTVDLVRPGRNFDFSPGKEDVWVVLLLLGKLTYAIHKLKCSAKVGKLEGLRDVMFFDDVPPIDLLLKQGELLTLEGRHASRSE